MEIHQPTPYRKLSIHFCEKISYIKGGQPRAAGGPPAIFVRPARPQREKNNMDEYNDSVAKGVGAARDKKYNSFTACGG